MDQQQNDTQAELTLLRSRINELEKQLSYVRTELTRMRPLPETNLVSENFLTRAFAVLGHYFVASLCITIPLYCIIFAMSMLLGR
jgi:hypothetical protein